ncbi:MAG: EscU/YscU/HrcU family type III secretion system export apparatus switch protein [Betaproteobacteria bacterium]|nr:EscU/YscU/HrcU family type III secretion system export apparatus switch protein [Betaproteobacteria bacterium]
MAEKTEPPTPKKIRDSRKKGQFLFSKEIVSLTTLIMVSGGLYMAKDEIFGRLHGLLTAAIALPNAKAFEQVAYELTIASLIAIGLAALFTYGPGLISSILANVGQVGLVFSAAKIKQGLKSLDAINNAKQMFSKKSLINFGFNIIKVIVIAAAVAWVVFDLLRDNLLSPSCGMVCVVDVTVSAFIYLVCICAAVFVPLAVIDYLIQRHLYMSELKMSIDEVKQEYKETEGNPEIKGQRKQLHRELVMSDARANVAKSSVMVTNPTHCAVALRYVEDETPLPYVVAKGEGSIAKMLIKAAEDAEVPIYHDVSLAWDLYGDVEQGHYIPVHLMKSVATVLRYINQQAASRAT